MTKFEEKLEILPIKNIEHPVGNTKYYMAVHVKSLIAQADEEIANLKSQLQQQALPVVPECVGDAIAWDEQIDNSIAETLKNVFTFGDRGLKEAGLWIKNNPEKYIIARNIGYTVEKPQLFYLKNKIELEDVGSDLIGYLNLFLTNGGYLTNNINRAKKFTQQEIDSMHAESYEQIEVAE